ncbi:MAG: hypothetical protein NXI04_29845 [Planctomycetaceae bacterium]|nr:hypothetical protein [Planctomycetaceae bacterium]
MPLNAESLTADPLQWQRVAPYHIARKRHRTPEIIDAAFHCLDHLHSQPNTERNDPQSRSADNALAAIGYEISDDADAAYELTRRIATYFRSPNVNLAFTALRQFERYRLSRYRIFVSEKLLDVATWDTQTPSPISMTLRGIAFLQLFYLDPEYKHWPQLVQARTECILGLQRWGAANPAHQSALRGITRYINGAT